MRASLAFSAPCPTGTTPGRANLTELTLFGPPTRRGASTANLATSVFEPKWAPVISTTSVGAETIAAGTHLGQRATGPPFRGVNLPSAPDPRQGARYGRVPAFRRMDRIGELSVDGCLPRPAPRICRPP